MFKTRERYACYYGSIGAPAVPLNSVLWAEYNRMVVPVGPCRLDYGVSAREARELLKAFPRALLVRATRSCPAPTGWYSVIGNRWTELAAMPGKLRSQVKRGLNNCDVRRIDARALRAEGYEVYRAAFDRYRNAGAPPLSPGEFRRRLAVQEDFGDIIEHWGCYRAGRLVCYATNYIYDTMEANYSMIKIHPAALGWYPSYALLYAMNQHYLHERRFACVNAGWRSILHETGIQGFLEKKFAFVHAYAALDLYYRPALGRAVSATYPFRSLLMRLDGRLKALYTLAEIHRRDHEQRAPF